MKSNHLTTEPDQQRSLAAPMLIGAGIGLLVILFFVTSANGDHDWGRYWMIRPLIIAPMAGAMGGAFYYLMDQLSRRGLNKTLALVLSVIVFVVGLWLGIVLGLDGTMWD